MIHSQGADWDISVEFGHRKEERKEDGIQGFLVGTGAGHWSVLLCSHPRPGAQTLSVCRVRPPRNLVGATDAGCQEEALAPKPSSSRGGEI